MTSRIATVLFALLFLVGMADAQVTSLTINGSSTVVSFAQGAMMHWEITLPAGGTSNDELWLDINENGTIDPATDRLLFQFAQIDGMSNNNDGPGDLDGLANGTIVFEAPLGLAPAKWLFSAKNNNIGPTVAFTVTQMLAPVATISGTVSGPVGAPKQYVVLEAKAQSSSGDYFWHGITDAAGNYTIKIGGAAQLGSQWRVGSSNGSAQIGLYILSPQEQVFNLTATVTNVNFNLTKGTVVTGFVTDGVNPIMNANAHTHNAFNPFPPTGDQSQYSGQTDASGKYQMVVGPGKYFMHFNLAGYFDQWWDHKTNNGSGAFDTLTVVAQDTIWNISGVLTKGALVRGRVTNWGSPVKAMVTIGTSQNMNMMSTNTDDFGEYSFTLTPGTYYLAFNYNSNILYYNSSSQPGQSINVVGTNTYDGYGANFNVGTPPPPPGPTIIRVWDVPNDQGKRVFVRFRVPILNGNIPKDYTQIMYFSLWRREAQGWTFAGEVPYRPDSVFTAIMPTLFDSTKTAGMFWSRFQVTAHYANLELTATSPTDSGYSLDNLAPIAPASPATRVTGSDVVVSWNAPLQDDEVMSYDVYRSTSSSFIIGPGTKYRTGLKSTTFTDAGAVGTTYYYRIVAVDDAGNESVPSQAVASVTGVEGESALPAEFALHQNYPNPFNPTTSISFDVASESFVTLRVFDMLGQEVRTLLNEQKSPGRYTATFDAAGLSSGLYFCRLTAGEKVMMQKMNLVK